MTAPTTAVDSRVALTFAHRAGDSTHWLEVTYPEGCEPTAMFDALAEVGFIDRDRERGLRPMPPMRAYGRNEVTGKDEPLDYMEHEVHLTNSGSGFFGRWTDEERRQNIANARRVLRRFGFTRVPVWHKTLADML